MSITLTNENKNNISVSLENRVNSPAIQDMDMTFDENTNTIELQSDIITLETKNSISLTLENK